MRFASAFRTALALLLATATHAFAADSSVANVAVSVQVSSRTVLHVSTEVLQFAVGDGGTEATTAVDFSAGARVPASADVVLTVESLRAIDGPGGAADLDAAVQFRGEGDATVAGALNPAAPAVAGRWHGSGRREGRLVFTLHASAPGIYTVPLRFVISTP